MEKHCFYGRLNANLDRRQNITVVERLHPNATAKPTFPEP